MSILSYVAVDGICPIDQCEHYSKNWNNNWHDRICKVENSLSFLCLYSFLGIRHLPLESMVVNNIFFIEQLNDSEEYNLTQCTNFPSRTHVYWLYRININKLSVLFALSVDNGYWQWQFQVQVTYNIESLCCVLNEWNKLGKYEPNIHHSNIGCGRKFSHHTTRHTMYNVFFWDLDVIVRDLKFS